MAAVNPDPVTRRAAIVLNGTRAEVVQAAGDCSLELQSYAANVSPSGGSGTVSVVASSQLCTWTATSDADWITLRTSPNGTGTGTVGFEVAPTNGPPRTGTISVNSLRFAVTQSQGCSYSIAPTSQNVDARGGTGTVTVTTGAGCPWTAGSNVDWITISQGPTGTGSGQVSFTVEPTDGPARIGTLVVAGQAFLVLQAPGCTYTVTPTSHTIPGGGGTASVSVATGGSCGWTATAEVPWIVVVGSSARTGPGIVDFSVPATSGAARSGTLVVAGQAVRVTQSQGCSYTIAPESQSMAASGGSGSVAVTAGDGCAWTASSNATWITVTEGSAGSGNATVRFTAAANTGPARSGTITVGGRTFTVNQEGGCSLTLSADSQTASAAGGTGSVNVSGPAGCAWTATSNVSWISVTGGSTGSGNGVVTFTIAANSGPARSGTLTIAGRTYTVNQAGNCSYGVAPPQRTVVAAGEVVSFNVTATSGCAWAAASQVPWIRVTDGASGTGNGTVQLTVDDNPGAARTGTVIVNGQTFTVTQESGCAYSVAPAVVTVTAAGGTSTVTVTTAAGCAWAATTGADWITVTSGASGSGTGDVQLTVAATTGPARSGTVTIGAQTVTVNQESGCTYTLSATSQQFPAEGGTGTVNVTTTAGCGWTAVSNVPWITVTAGAAGAGNGIVQFTVAANTGAARTGTITIAGQTFTVTQ
jgi:hypothetical protein